MRRKKPSDLKRMSDAALARYVLDLADEVAELSAALKLAKREKRARAAKGKKRTAQRAACGQRAELPDTFLVSPSGRLH